MSDLDAHQTSVAFFVLNHALLGEEVDHGKNGVFGDLNGLVWYTLKALVSSVLNLNLELPSRRVERNDVTEADKAAAQASKDGDLGRV